MTAVQMREASEKKTGYGLIALLCLAYGVGYLGRQNYAVCLAEIVVREGVLKSEAALATTALFISYGLGQLVSGWLGDRVAPRWIISGGLVFSGLMNLILPLCGNVRTMAAVWAVNGFAQAMLWPPITRCMAEYLSPDMYKKGCVLVPMASSLATVLLFLLVPVLIRSSGWRSVFRISMTAEVLSAGVVFLFLTRWEKQPGSAEQPVSAEDPGCAAAKKTGIGRVLVSCGLIPVMAAIVMQGLLRDGVEAWLPTYLVEMFHWETGSSIFSSVLLPVFCMIAFPLFQWINGKVKGGEEKLSMLLFVISALCAVLIVTAGSGSAAAVVALASTLAALMHGINMLLICNIPARYLETGRVSTISGILNGCTYVGSALSTWGFAKTAQSLGWTATVVLWAVIAAAGAGFLLLCRKKAK